MQSYHSDIIEFSKQLATLPRTWNGMECVLELKEADYNWRQMEWFGWYFEFKARQVLKNVATIPGDRHGNVTFDLKKHINWDLKASAKKIVILNDQQAMDISISATGVHGEIIALFDVEYDLNRSFQIWHTDLKGGKSVYELEREGRTEKSRLRKVKATLKEIIFVVFKNNDLKTLSIMKQGRNADGSSRKIKYKLDISKLDNYEHHSLKFD